ncbi:MAG: DUF4397 domain-containing protein [Aggregatilineales bacterium]
MRKLIALIIVAILLLSAVVPALAQDRPSIPELLANDGRFSTLLAAVQAAGLADVLSGEGPFTLLAPTDEAIAASLQELGLTPEDLLADRETLTDILLFHVLPGRYFFRELTSGPTIETALEGASVTFNLERGVFTANGVEIRNPDQVASNGIVHVAQRVLIPPSVQRMLDASRSFVRVAHFSPDGGTVDVYVNDELLLEGVTFGVVSDWVEVSEGAYRFAVVPTGQEPGGSVIRRVNAGTRTTVAATGIVAIDRRIQLNFLDEDYSELADGRTRVSVFHAIKGAPVVDVLANGNLLIGALGYPGTLGDNDGFDTREVGAGVYDIAIVPAGATEPVILELAGTRLLAGVNYFIAAIGTPNNPQVVVVPTPQ